MSMEIALYRALLEAGVQTETAERVVHGMEEEIGMQIQSQIGQLATKSDLAELKAATAEMKTDIIRWMFTAIVAAAGVFAAVSKVLH